MKIVLLGPISTAGIAEFLYEPVPKDFPEGYKGAPFLSTLIAELLARGHEVCAITAGGYVATRDNKPLSLKGARFEYYCCPCRKHSIYPSAGRVGRIVDLFAYERQEMINVIALSKPDFVHAHWTYEFALAAMGSGVPYLITAHDDPARVLKLYKNLYRLGRYFMARYVLYAATAISAVSDDLKHRIAPLTRCEISVVPNPLSSKFIDVGVLRETLSLSSEQRIISVNNGWSYLKNVSNSLRAFSYIRKHIQGVTYHLYGNDYELGGAAEKWALANELSEGVFFHGPVTHDDLVIAFNKSTLMIHPSRIESCPMGIAEAMALGLPIVGGNDSGGVSWMVEGGGTLVDINQPLKIAEAVVELLTKQDFYTKCAIAAKKRVLAFSSETIAGQYLEIYDHILKVGLI